MKTASCEILAELLLDERDPERSGIRLVEWAQACKAHGVVIPRGSGMTDQIIRALVQAATARQLRCHLEPVKDAYTDSFPHPWKALSAALNGSRAVMKGLTLNRSLGGPAHAGGLYPHELRDLVEFVSPEQAGQDERGVADTQSLVAKTSLRAGTLLRPDMLESRPDLFGVTVDMAKTLNGVKLLFAREPNEPMTFGVIEPMSGRSTGASLEVSVVIRTKNEQAWLERALSALRHQRRPPTDIIVVDNESTDGTVGVAERFGCRVLTISDREFSFGRALNRGIAATDTPWVASLSAHCIPVHDRWLEAFMHRLRPPFMAAAYGRQEPLPNSTDFDKRDLWTTFGEEPRVQTGRDFFFHNANSLINRAVWQRIPFDESLNGVEDRDWAKKVLADGHYLLYQPLASVHHYHGIHQGRNVERARRVVKVIEFIQQRDPALEAAQRSA